MVIKSEIKIECGITSESSEVMNDNMKYLEKLKEINLGSKKYNKIDNKIGDGGCSAIFSNLKYLPNLEKLELGSRDVTQGCNCGITSKSCEVINANVRYLEKLKILNLGSKNENKIANEIMDPGCKAIFLNAKYLVNLEKLWLNGNKE